MDFFAMTDCLLMVISIIMIKLLEMSSYSGESNKIYLDVKICLLFFSVLDKVKTVRRGESGKLMLQCYTVMS